MVGGYRPVDAVLQGKQVYVTWLAQEKNKDVGRLVSICEGVSVGVVDGTASVEDKRFVLGCYRLLFRLGPSAYRDAQ